MEPELAKYICSTWNVLRRSHLDVPPDCKVGRSDVSFLYVPKIEQANKIQWRIGKRQINFPAKTPIEVRQLPDDPSTITDHGILYLPNDYVVPGERFQEMYGWDSKWIVQGLLHDGQLTLAKGMVENCFYEIENYGGKVLNANRTYYYERSHPPLTGPMVFAVAKHLHGSKRLKFLQRAANALSTNLDFWKTHRYTEETGLFHYGHYDDAKLGFCPEVLYGERDPVTNLSHYHKVAEHLKKLPASDPLRTRFYDEKTGFLTPAAAAGDRAMRESGFDPSMIMGYYGLETIDHNPVCLNSLLYIQNKILADIYQELGKHNEFEKYNAEAVRIETQCRRYLLDKQTGLFVNYNYKTGQLSDFPFLTSAYPLWAGFATPEEARSFQKNLNLFETDHGVITTSRETGCHWDNHMWLNMTYFAFAGLARYPELVPDALRIGQKSIDTVGRVFREHNTVFEKYTRHGTSHVDVSMGYAVNDIGFGWSNGATLDMHKTMEAGLPYAIPVSGRGIILPQYQLMHVALRHATMR